MSSNERLHESDLDAVAGGIGNGPSPTVYSPFGYPGTFGPVVWPPVDPNTASGLPPMIKPGGPPPGY